MRFANPEWALAYPGIMQANLQLGFDRAREAWEQGRPIYAVAMA